MDRVEDELKLNPIEFGKFKMIRKSEDKYLGQILHEDGLAESVAATVASRAGRFKGAIFEIRSVIEEFSMESMGGMMAAKTLLERALLPSLLSGSCNWTGIRKTTEDDCDDLLLMYWRVMMKVPESTPKIGLISESENLEREDDVSEKNTATGAVVSGQESL